MKCMDRDFLLNTATAQQLYHGTAATMPIIDYHSHVSPQEIAEDRSFDNLTQLWLSGDHYKWRLMRWCGLDERLITGNADDREKFDAYAWALPQAIGNPLYSWTHLELRRYFACDAFLSPDTANSIWHSANERLRGGLSVRKIIAQSNVQALCTTDDPADDLHWHKMIAEDKSFSVGVYPTFRPDNALAIRKPGFLAYMQKLAESAGHPIQTLDDLFAALSARLDYFASHGCFIADHGLAAIPWSPHDTADAIMGRALAGDTINACDEEAYQTTVMLFLGREYARRDMTMQLHYGVQRNVNPPQFRLIGPDSGFDTIDTPNCTQNLTCLLGALEDTNSLPKTILYSLNPSDNAMLACLAGSFPQGGIAGKVQHGSAWWFNDTKTGMKNQLTTLAETGVLGSFVGMLTDSRSFTSYVRHEYFRRILCGLLGEWVENGEYPQDMPALERHVRNISHDNAERYFGIGSAR